MEQRTRRVAILPGDDAAPEAVHASLTVLKQLELPVDWVVLPDGEALSATTSREDAEQLVRETANSCDSLLFGATSGKTPGIGYLRWGKETYANVRPVRWRPGFRSPLRGPEGIDYVIVRENIEDLYLGIEGDLESLLSSNLDLTPRSGIGSPIRSRDGRYAVKVITRENTERVAHFSCRLALKRKAEGHPGKVTCACKYNVLRRSDGFFRETVREVVRGYPDIEYEEFIVDDFARRLVASPQALDVVVMPNLYGDILSDEGAGTIGGLGLAPSGCYGDAWAYFESVHGTAPDIAGQHAINPTATLLSAVLMLDYLGFGDQSRRLEQAIEQTYAAGACLTRDQGGTATTEQFANEVTTRL
ncbi:MAG: isocitrate/isopropylmalate dehydrogenase family protein [Dehalococcoidia bacterium]